MLHVLDLKYVPCINIVYINTFVITIIFIYYYVMEEIETIKKKSFQIVVAYTYLSLLIITNVYVKYYLVYG